MAKRVVIELEVDSGTGLATIKNFGNTFDTEMKKVERSTKSAASSLQLLKFDAIIRFAERAFGYTQQIWNFGKAVTSMASDIERTSKVLGISTDEYQKWTYAAKQADAPIEALHGGMRILAKNLEDAARGTGEAREYLQALGITTRNLPQAILQIADAFSKTEDGAEKMAWAGKLLGERYGIQLVPLLNQGKAGIHGLGEEAKKLGIVVSEDVIKKGADAEKTFKDMDEKIKALKLTLAPLAGEFAKMIDSMVTNIQRLNSYIYELGENFEAWLKRSMVSNFGMKPSTVPFIEPPSGFYPPLTKGKGGLPSIAGKGVIAKAEDWESMGAVHLGKAIAAHQMKPESWLDALEEYQINLKGIMTLEEQRDKIIEDQIKQFNEINALNEQWIADEWEKEQGIDAVLKRINEVTFAEERLGEAAVLRHEFITEAWKKQRDALKENTKDLNIFENALTQVFDGLISGTLKGKDAFKSFTYAITKQQLPQMIDQIKGAFTQVGNWISSLPSKFGYYKPGMTTPSGQVLTSDQTQLGGGIQNILGSVAQWIGGTMSSEKGQVSLMQTVGMAVDFFKAISASASSLKAKELKMKNIGITAGKVIGQIAGLFTGGTLSGLFSYIGEALGRFTHSMVMYFYGSDKKKKEIDKMLEERRAMVRKTLFEWGFELPMTESGKVSAKAIREQGGVFGSFSYGDFRGAKRARQILEIAAGIKESVVEGITGALSEALQSYNAVKVFGQTLRESVYASVYEGMVNAFTAASQISKTLTPLYQAIYETTADALKKGFDPETYRELILSKWRAIEPEIAGMAPIITLLAQISKELKTDIMGTTGGGRVTIPTFQQGGTMPYTGLALVHKGEKVTPEGEGGVTVNINNPVISNKQDIYDLARQIGRIVDWERRRPVAHG